MIRKVKIKLTRENILLIILLIVSIIVLLIGLSMATSKTFNRVEGGIIVNKKYIPERQEKKFKKDGMVIVEYTDLQVPEYIFTIKDEKKLSYSEEKINVTQSEYLQYEIGDYYCRGEEALNKYGVEKQLLVCMEEPAELIQAISKAERYPNDEKYIDRLIEEIADVLICIEYLKKIYDIDQSKVEKWESKKLKRVLKRMNEV